MTTEPVSAPAVTTTTLKGRRPVRLFALVLAIVMIGSACAGSGSDPLTVDGVAITTEVIERELSILEDHPDFSQILLDGTLEATGSTPDRMSSTTASRLLSRRALIQVSDNELGDRNARVTNGEVAAEHANLDRLIGDPFSTLPTEYRQDLARGEATRNKLAGLLAAEQGLTVPQSARDIYDANPQAFVQSCSRHILVATETEALEAMDRIEGGEDFGAVAMEISLDGSGQNGGDLGCVQPGAFVPEFEDVAFSAEPGVLSGPVQTQFGFHLIIVDSREAASFADVEAELAAQVDQQRANNLNQAFGDWLDVRRESVDVDVDPRFGTWDSQGFRVMSPSESTPGS